MIKLKSLLFEKEEERRNKEAKERTLEILDSLPVEKSDCDCKLCPDNYCHLKPYDDHVEELQDKIQFYKDNL